MPLYKISNFTELVRWKAWLFSIIFLLAGFFLRRPEAIPSVLLIIIFLLINSWGFTINDYFDSGFDKINRKTRNPVSLRKIKRKHVALLCAAILIIVVLLALKLPIYSQIMILILFLGYFLYSGLRLKETPWGAILHGLSGPFWFLCAYFAAGGPDFQALIFSILFFIPSFLMGLTSEIRDLDIDRKSGFRTMALSLKYKNSLNLIRFLSFIMILVFVLCVFLFLQLIFLLYTPAFIFYLIMLSDSPKEKDIFSRTMESWNRGKIIFFVASIIIIIYFILSPFLF